MNSTELKNRREKLGLSQKDLEELLGVERSTNLSLGKELGKSSHFKTWKMLKANEN